MSMTHGEQVRNESYQAEQPHIGDAQRTVMDFVRGCGRHGATRKEIASATGLQLSSVCGRVRELLDADSLVESGETRIGVSGKSNSVVIAAEVKGNAWEFQGSWQCVREGSEQPIGEADGSTGTRNSGQQGNRTERRTGGKVQGEARHGVVNPGTSVVATPEAERVAAAVQFVADERRQIETWRVGMEIMKLRSRGVLAWPDGNSVQWEAAVNEAVRQGLLTLKDGKVRLTVVEPEAKPVQQELF